MTTQEVDALLQRNAELEKELADKNRKLQIEAALEKVRSRVLAMQKPEELVEVAHLLRNVMGSLGIEELEGSSISVHNEATGKTDMWYAIKDEKRENKFVAGSISMYLNETWVGRQMLQFYHSGQKQISIPMKGEHRKEWISYFSEHSSAALGRFYDDTIPDRTYHLYRFSNGFIGAASPGDISAESWALLQRATAVFSMAYTRFSDLQKAETHAREARIEAALERLRARTMAMQKSDELDETNMLILRQLESLDISLSGIGIHIGYPDTPESEAWMWDRLSGKVPKVIYNHTHDRLSERIYEGWKKGETLYVEEVNGERLKEHLNYISSLLHDPTIYEDSVLSFVFHIVYFTYGFFVLATPDHCPTEYPVFIRFAKVFEQTYTRFLDLQKAEAQAREARIEAALERIRSSTMAMHHSSELAETSAVLFRELHVLHIETIRSGVSIIDEKSKTGEFWLTTHLNNLIETKIVGVVPVTAHPIFEAAFENWKRRMPFYAFELVGDDVRHYYEAVSSYLHIPLPQSYHPREVFQTFYFPEGSLNVITLHPLSEEECGVIMRFTRVFELMYRRFLDLQKAEAQAREALRRASLDRVRAEIASMRSTGDLERITPLIWNELTHMQVPFIRCGVFIMNEVSEQIHVYLSTPDGKAIAAFSLQMNTGGLSHDVLTNWRQNRFFMNHWNAAAFSDWIESLTAKGVIGLDEKYATEKPPDNLFLHFFPFLQGMLYVGSARPLNDDEINQVQSLADTFSTAYARYEDFSKLEAAKQQIEITLEKLKSTQAQLIQKEKMASLGELTAGIAHEIQNPLNFVNNFSSVNKELLDELELANKKGDQAEVSIIAADIKANLEKIYHHGRRADSIVKGMLQHSRVSTGKKEPVNINQLADEYMRLSYLGLRAKDKAFDAHIQTHFDQGIGNIQAVPQDIGRVLLNLFNNAFYAVQEKKAKLNGTFEPIVSVSTKKRGDQVVITVRDNGTGMPQEVAEKVFQPFFTTKPTGEGTGLGLSLSYDIITKGHGGELRVESKEGEGTEFVVELPA